MILFKKIKLLFTYISKVKSIQFDLEEQFGARIDNIYRIYTVFNIPQNLFEEPYNLRKSDIDTIAKNYIVDFRRSFSDFLVKRGMMELFDVYEIRKVDKFSYLIVFGFSLINTKKLANAFLLMIPLSVIIGLIVFFVSKF